MARAGQRAGGAFSAAAGAAAKAASSCGSAAHAPRRLIQVEPWQSSASSRLTTVPAQLDFFQAACSSWKFTSVAAACEGKDVSASLSVRALWVGSGLLGVGCSGFRASCDICTMDECACEEHAVGDAPEGKDVWTCVRTRDRTLCCLAGPRSEHALGQSCWNVL